MSYRTDGRERVMAILCPFLVLYLAHAADTWFKQDFITTGVACCVLGASFLVFFLIFFFRVFDIGQ
jgi:hypothetical protein